MSDITTVILAAGNSTRFKANKSKLVYPLCGLPIISHIFNIAKKILRSAKTNIGVHIHNNIGLANKISCESILRGYFVDSTLLGKGRMGGNADTILLILFRALSITGNIKKIDKLIEKLFDCTSLIWGNESRDHIVSIMKYNI